MTDMVTVARNLREIERLANELQAQAIADSRSRLMPGGRAMVAMAPVANLEAWENLNAATDRAAGRSTVAALTGIGKAYTSDEDEDPEKAWPPFQMLVFWSEGWRSETGTEYDDERWKPTIQSEASFLRHALEWAWDNEAQWDDFAKDVATAKTKLENILSEGERAERGVPCWYEECKGVNLVRKIQPKRDKDGHKVWELSDWHCPKCHRSWDEDAYARMVTAGNEAAKVVTIGDETWVSVDYAARKFKRTVKTIRTWVNRGHVATSCVIAGRRTQFVLLSDVETRHNESGRRVRK